MRSTVQRTYVRESDVDGGRRAGATAGLDLGLDLHNESPVRVVVSVRITIQQTNVCESDEGAAAHAAAGLDLGLDLHGQSPVG